MPGYTSTTTYVFIAWYVIVCNGHKVESKPNSVEAIRVYALRYEYRLHIKSKGIHVTDRGGSKACFL
jgi:hypothetical protein